MAARKEAPPADAVLEAYGASCATLTPLIKAKLGELSTGDVLEVRSSDPSASEGVPAWSRLTGNQLIAAVEEEAGPARFFLQKK